MRLLLAFVFLFSIFTNAFACVEFWAQIEFYNSGGNAAINYNLVDNGASICSGSTIVNNPDSVGFIQLGCQSGFYADFSWQSTNPVSFAYPGFKGTFNTAANYDGEPEYEVYYFTYTASVWGC